MLRRSLQIRAVLLLAVFLSAGTSLPSLDAVLHHGGTAEAGSQSHVEVAGECVDHAGHCELGRTPTGSNAVAGLAGSIHSEPLPQPTQIHAADRPQVDADHYATARPRAPPSPVV
ncbi:MAG TPA: hypothetical protein VHH32_09270 [Gemmatimonadales bacterium]|nr:hypothetical protein [Gemmatimonadales bacterium]